MPGRRSGCCCWRGPPGTGGTGWSASRSWTAPARSWTWTGIRSRPPTGPSTSAAPAPRSPPTAAPGRSRPAPPPAELADPAYAEPLLIHIAALLRTVDMPATPAPPGPGQDRAAGDDIAAAEPGAPVRQRLLRALCERERTRWYQPGRRVTSVLQPGPAAGRPGGRAGHADRRRRPGVRHVPARGGAEPGRGHPDRGRGAGGMGAPAVCRARLLEPAAAGPARRAAPGRHRAAARPGHRRRPARRRAALGSRACLPSCWPS